MTDLAASSLSRIDLFCKAARTLSFTDAAELAGTTPSAVSKAVKRLEDQLDVKLFSRTTRAIRLTAEGASYYEVCRDALARIGEAELLLARGRTRPHGTLRLSMPPSYGIVDLVPRLPRYIERYQHDVKIVASLSNAVTEFVTDGFDLAVRLGKVADSRLVARRLRDAHGKVVASPQYLARHGIPTHPDELRAHRCIDLILPDTRKPVPWTFTRGRRTWQLAVQPALSVDQPLAAASAAMAGGGFAWLLDFSVAADIAQGRLVEVLSDFRSAGTPISIVYPGNRHLSVNVRTFVDFILQEYAREEEAGSAG